MSIDTALYTRLSGFAGLAALVSTRIYPQPVPQNATYPLVTYTQISGMRDYVYSNQSGFVQGRWQLDAYATTIAGARLVAEQIRMALSNYHGTSDSVVIDLSVMLDETQFYEDDTKLHRLSHDYLITYRETTPS